VTKFLTSELRGDSISQEVEILDQERKFIACFSPYLFFYNNPTGTIIFKVTKSAVVVFQSTIDLGNIKAEIGTTSDYIHLFYPIIPINPLSLERGAYTISIEAGTYSYSPSSYIGWSSQHENIQSIFNYVAIDDTENPLAMRVKVLKKGILI
jgi:hypothetical protein